MPVLSFQLPTIISSQQPASLILLHANAQEQTQLVKARKTCSKSFYGEQPNNPSRTFHRPCYKRSFLFLSGDGESGEGHERCDPESNFNVRKSNLCEALDVF